VNTRLTTGHWPGAPMSARPDRPCARGEHTRPPQWQAIGSWSESRLVPMRADLDGMCGGPLRMGAIGG
jgi:hypothetical protein